MLKIPTKQKKRGYVSSYFKVEQYMALNRAFFEVGRKKFQSVCAPEKF
jgi:hypothetical protein